MNENFLDVIEGLYVAMTKICKEDEFLEDGISLSSVPHPNKIPGAFKRRFKNVKRIIT